MCANGAFAVQLNDSSTVTFVCAEASLLNNVQWYTGTCKDAQRNSYTTIGGMCQQAGGSEGGRSCCIFKTAIY
jgi:hypothetical protein